jgi:hypothetical protein
MFVIVLAFLGGPVPDRPMIGAMPSSYFSECWMLRFDGA